MEPSDDGQLHLAEHPEDASKVITWLAAHRSSH
jgi:hypothetical protein